MMAAQWGLYYKIHIKHECSSLVSTNCGRRRWCAGTHAQLTRTPTAISWCANAIGISIYFRLTTPCARNVCPLSIGRSRLQKYGNDRKCSVCIVWCWYGTYLDMWGSTESARRSQLSRSNRTYNYRRCVFIHAKSNDVNNILYHWNRRTEMLWFCLFVHTICVCLFMPSWMKPRRLRSKYITTRTCNPFMNQLNKPTQICISVALASWTLLIVCLLVFVCQVQHAVSQQRRFE